MEYMVSASTDKGLVKDTNQDSYAIRIADSKVGRVLFAVLCDGMGGYSKGELASGTVVAAFCDWFERRFPELLDNKLDDKILRDEWDRLIQTCNEHIKQYGQVKGISLGTTVTAMLITESYFFVLNVGDSRAYKIGSQAEVLTLDQTVVAQEIALGRLTEEEAKHDPRRSVLLQCVGASDMVIPDIFIGKTEKNIVYMLCSDGFRHEITNKEISAHLNPRVMVDTDIMKKNLDDLIELNKERNEKDNITVVAVRTL